MRKHALHDCCSLIAYIICGQSAAVKGAVAEDSYARVLKSRIKQADLIAKPLKDRVVVMLEALSQSEAGFYSSEN